MMRATTLFTLLLAMTLTVTGCGREDSAPAPATNESPDQSQEHNHNDDHADGHGEGDGGHHSGPKHELGSEEVGDATVTVNQVGEVEAGGPATFEIFIDGQDAEPAAVRAWVGNEQAIGSVKVRAVERPEFYDADLEVPAEMPEDSRFWVDIETEDGERHAVSFPLHE